MVPRSLCAAFAASLAFAILAVSAHAGDYHVYSCRTPSGGSAPADGWSGSLAPGSAFDDYAVNTCPQGGALIAALGDQTVHAVNTDLARWTFSAPAGARIGSAELWRAGDTAGGAVVNATYQFWLAGSSVTSIFDECIYTLKCSIEGDLTTSLSADNRVVVPAANLGSNLYSNVSCGGAAGSQCPAGSGDKNGYAAALYLYAADIELEQNVGPSASGVGGELASASSVRGTSSVAFNATDPGSGVYEAVLSVDGQVVQASVVNDNGGRCRDVGQSSDGKPAFLYVEPCLGSVSVDVPFDTTKLSNGPHRLIVSVIDAAGNSAPVLDRQITVANPPPPCAGRAGSATSASGQASLSASWRGTRKTNIISGYRRMPTIDGRLIGPGGAPIPGASIDLVATTTLAGARPAAMASPRTGQDGRFSVRMPRGASSRILCLAYRGPGGGAPSVTTLTLRVHAGIALRVSPHTASAGRSIAFRGRLLGGPIPRGGKQLVLEARSAGSGWLEFKVIRTDARGRFHAAYRFKFPGPADYGFRVRSEAESDYPFAAGSSNVVGVRER